MIRPPPTVTLFPYTTLFRSKKDATKIPEDIVNAADDLQKKVDAAAEKFIRPRHALGNAGPPLEWHPDPLPNQVQRLLHDLDGSTATPDGQQQEETAEPTTRVPAAFAAVKAI